MRSVFKFASPLRSLISRFRTADLDPLLLRSRYAHPASTYIKMGEHTHHVIDEGRGPALLLLHGTASSARSWDGWAERLRTQYRVIRPDLPGFGLTCAVAGHGHSMAAHVRTLCYLLDELGVHQAYVAGNSLGGQIGAHLAAAHPERVRALVLVGPGGFNRPAPGPFAFTRIPVVGDVLREVAPRFATAAGLAWAYGNPLAVRSATARLYHDLLLGPGNRRAMFDAIAQAPVHAETERALHLVTCKVLLLWGGRDRLARPAEAQRFLTHLKCACLVTYAELGHVPQEEDPMRTCRDLERFLTVLGKEAELLPA